MAVMGKSVWGIEGGRKELPKRPKGGLLKSVGIKQPGLEHCTEDNLSYMLFHKMGGGKKPDRAIRKGNDDSEIRSGGAKEV